MGARSSLCHRVRYCLKKKKGKRRNQKIQTNKKNNTIKEVTILVMVCDPAPPPTALPLPSPRTLGEGTLPGAHSLPPQP